MLRSSGGRCRKAMLGVFEGRCRKAMLGLCPVPTLQSWLSDTLEEGCRKPELGFCPAPPPRSHSFWAVLFITHVTWSPWPRLTISDRGCVDRPPAPPTSTPLHLRRVCVDLQDCCIQTCTDLRDCCIQTCTELQDCCIQIYVSKLSWVSRWRMPQSKSHGLAF